MTLAMGGLVWTCLAPQALVFNTCPRSTRLLIAGAKQMAVEYARFRGAIITQRRFQSIINASRHHGSLYQTIAILGRAMPCCTVCRPSVAFPVEGGPAVASSAT